MEKSFSPLETTKMSNKQTTNPKYTRLTAKKRAQLQKIKIDPEVVKSLAGQGLSRWEITRQYYGFNFDPSRKAASSTWLFYQKINAVLKSTNTPVAHATSNANADYLQAKIAALIQNDVEYESVAQLKEKLRELL
jgi:hypothetical protein